MSTLSRPPEVKSNIRRVAILFSGGPAPAANAVISTAATAFLRNNIDVIGVLNGYSHLLEYSPSHPLQEDRDYLRLDLKTLKRTRNRRGIILGTARANPGKLIGGPDDMKNPERNAPLRTVYEALSSLEVDALISIGGDDTLKTANKFKMFQDQLPQGSRRIRVVHVPKTIDNDYTGIDYTFGYFTAVEVIGSEIRNLIADAEAGRSYYLCETMGRSAGWLAYGAAIAGEASLVISVEDIVGKYRGEEEVKDEATGRTHKRPVMNVDEIVQRIIRTMLAREREGKEFGVIVLAEGLAELLPYERLKGIKIDEFGHISIASVNLGKTFAKLVAAEYQKQTGRERKVTGLQLGYEARCAPPLAFDVLLGSQLGVGSYRALVEAGKDGVMVSVSGQLKLNYIPFEDLVDPKTLVTLVRFIERDSDFHSLARFLETYVTD